jgi:hypothetical protein
METEGRSVTLQMTGRAIQNRQLASRPEMDPCGDGGFNHWTANAQTADVANCRPHLGGFQT